MVEMKIFDFENSAFIAEQLFSENLNFIITLIIIVSHIIKFQFHGEFKYIYYTFKYNPS